MSVSLPAHPLDVDLADMVDGLLDDVRTAQVEAHLSGCPVCRARCDRLHRASPAAPPVDRPLPVVELPLPGGSGDGLDAEPVVDDLWLLGTDERVLVLVLRLDRDRALVAPVTFDIEAADEETQVVDAADSPLATGLAVHPRLATEVPRSVLERRIAHLERVGGRMGAAVVGADDPRLEIRQHLADRLGSFDDRPPDPGTGSDAPPPRPEHVRSSLIADLRALRGRVCAVRPLFDWDDVLPAHRAGWAPIAVIDEVGIVLVVLDTPHGLADDVDFDTARSVLTRLNCTALVVLAGGVSDLAEVFDSSSLNYGIDAPSGRHSSPRPLLSGLAPFDAIAKFLDQTTGARAAAPPSRGPVTRVDVGDVLREAAAAALADAARQGARSKIAPKRRGYESIADAQERFEVALGRAFGAESVVPGLLEIAPRSDG